MGPLVAETGIAVVYYFALRGPLWQRSLAAVLALLGPLIMIFVVDPSVSGLNKTARLSLVVGFLGLHGVGLIAGRAFDQQRRARHDAEAHERRTNQLLTASLQALSVEKERAEELARARSTFIATMSHEFRTPMNAIINLSALQLDAALSPSSREDISIIHESARSLLMLLNDILDYSKLDAGKLEICPAPTHLKELMEGVVRMLTPQATAKHNTLVLQSSKGCPEWVLLDGVRLRQVLVNLVSNAIKFTERGRIEVRVSASPRPEGRHLLSVEVADEGVGISLDAQARIFQPFEQANRGVELNWGGTGLGLTICKHIITAMGGQIGVTSAPDQGAVFHFSLEVEPAQPDSPRPDAPSHSELTSDLPRLSILVVDDNPINLRVARAMLSKLGQEVTSCASGREAVDLTGTTPFDLVLMDMQMPGMNGTDATSQILAAQRAWPPPRVVALSASVLEEDLAACRRVGMADFLGKPVQPNDLRRVILQTKAHNFSAPPAHP